MVRRVCRELGNKKNIVIINDEAHHCYRRRPEGPEEKLKGDERIETQKREAAARIWISSLEAVKEKVGLSRWWAGPWRTGLSGKLPIPG